MDGVTYKVRVLPIDKIIEVQEGTTYLDAQIQAGLHPDAPCGGLGTCGKCLVNVAEGLVDPKDLENVKVLTVKACQHKVEQDVTLIAEEVSTHHILETGAQRKFQLAPAVRSGVIHVERCEMGDNSSDWQRVKEAVSSVFKIDADSIPVNPDILDKVFDTLDANDYKATAVLYNNEIIDLLPPDENFKAYGAAFDIGTTSVVCYLLDLTTGKEISHSSTLNPQSQFGADVIARS
ncbi:MAG: 2Fe-2S iron-sulfur cluster binding domain-containing protein, partial [Parasporobacterium sp.]|nr:2Fe-2S iron-sulfur cluster binding domain-containing protein [Parasporobacterium sp.]